MTELLFPKCATPSEASDDKLANVRVRLYDSEGNSVITGGKEIRSSNECEQITT